MSKLNVLATLKAVSKKLSSELETAGVEETKRTKIVKIIDDQISPAINDLEELSKALEDEPSNRVELVKNALGKELGQETEEEAAELEKKGQYRDPKTGKIRNHIFV